MNGTFSWLAIGTMAIDTGVSRPPNSTATFSLKISSRAATTPLAGLPSSSRLTSSTLRPPSRPPFALISSIATLSPRVIASPACADWPDKAVTRPILMVSAACAAGMAAAPRAAMHAAMTVRRLKEIMVPSFV